MSRRYITIFDVIVLLIHLQAAKGRIFVGTAGDPRGFNPAICIPQSQLYER